jgi:hypothetical protein
MCPANSGDRGSNGVKSLCFTFNHFPSESNYLNGTIVNIIVTFYTKSHSLPNFVGCVVGFLNVWTIRLRSLLLAAALCFECNLVLISVTGHSVNGPAGYLFVTAA